MGEPPALKRTTIWMQIKGLLFSTLVLLSALMGTIYIFTPLLPLMFLSHRLWRRVIDRLVGFWLLMPCGLIEVLFGARITATGSRIDHGEPALVIMNHRTCLDWLFFWNVLIRMDPWLLTSQKISVKAVLRYTVGTGWAMAANCYMFLKRQFEKDRNHIETMIEYYATSGYCYQLLLFPEGTDKCPRATERSRQFALKKNLVHYNYVLHPRTTGFKCILRKMRQLEYVKNIYDVTVGYADAIVQSEFELIFSGACPKNIHFHVNKLNVNSLPEKEESVAEWLRTLWESKEAKLSKFYDSDDIKKRSFMDHSCGHTFELTTMGVLIYGAVVIFWLFMSIFLTYAFFHYSSQYLLALLTIFIFVGSEFLFDGFEHVPIQIAKDTSNIVKHEILNDEQERSIPKISSSVPSEPVLVY